MDDKPKLRHKCLCSLYEDKSMSIEIEKGKRNNEDFLLHFADIDNSNDPFLIFFTLRSGPISYKEYLVTKKYFFEGLSVKTIANQCALSLDRTQYICDRTFCRIIGMFKSFIKEDYLKLIKNDEKNRALNKEIKKLNLKFENFCSFVRNNNPDLVEQYDLERCEPKCYQIKIKDLHLSAKVYSSLKRMQIETIGDLAQTTLYRLKRSTNLGNKSLNNLFRKLADYGIVLEEGNWFSY